MIFRESTVLVTGSARTDEEHMSDKRPSGIERLAPDKLLPKTTMAGLEPGIIASIGILVDLLPHQTVHNKERLENVIRTLESLRALARCVSRSGDKDPLFITLKDDWLKTFRHNRKNAFKNLALLAEKLGIGESTLRLIESGHRVPSWETMEVLLACAELKLDRDHMFVQIIMNRPQWPGSTG